MEYKDFLFLFALCAGPLSALVLLCALDRIRGPGIRVSATEFLTRLRDGAVVVLSLPANTRRHFYPRRPRSVDEDTGWHVRPATREESERYEQYLSRLQGFQS